ncbi:hypothetical protein [Dorea sp. D27]|uniref:hypothetical protein n=1 Tax=Dorea sp. D27 TaxID=658665 RepID=UPI0006736CF9|nr:hypothetical protein [Dorea sp. D27]
MEIQRAIDNLACMKMEIRDSEDVRQLKRVRIDTVDAAIAALKEKKYKSWIPVSERLPDDCVNSITEDAYVYPVTVKLGEITDIRYYSFCRGHWYNQGPAEMDDLVIAWMPRPEPYMSQTLKYADNDVAQMGLMPAT